MKTKKVALSLAVILLLAVVAFLLLRVAQKQYHTAEPVCRVSRQNACDNAMVLVEPRQIPQSSASDDIHLGFIEFDDQGQLWSPAQARKVLDSVQELAAQRPVSVVVFAHGWNHNAAATDANVSSFRQMLRDLFDAEARFAQSANRQQERAIVGIYLGWRGKSARGPAFLPTFWARKAVAHQVGNDGAFEILQRLSELRGAGLKPDRNRLIMVGHSFGGALMFAATAHALGASLEELSAGSGRRFADLVVIINAAVEAQRFESLLRRSRELEAQLRGQMPVFVAITSTNDLATKVAFPLGRRFATLFNSYRDGQSESDRIAIGHYKPFLTHVLAPCQTPDAFAALTTCPEKSANAAVRDVSNPAYMMAIRATAAAWKRNRNQPNWRISFPTGVLQHAAGPADGPVLNIVTHQSLIADHNDIWQSPLLLFVRDLIAINHFADRSSEPPVTPATDRPSSRPERGAFGVAAAHR
jgi:pimeloyl-ACP methyl ester carboxylesterase